MPLRRRAHMKRRSIRTGPPLAVRRLVLERDQYRCALCGIALAGRPYSLHHRRNRGAGGSSDPAINSPANLLSVCGTGTTLCHGWLGANPRPALAAGYVVSLNSTEDPAAVPVRHAVHGTVLLTHDGLVRGWQ